MASIILRGVGTAVGAALVPFVGGTFGGVLGSLAGSAIDNALGLGTKIQGPQLENLSVQDSRYGAGIPIVYGNARIAGNVIWSTDLMQASQTQNVGGGKGGGSTTVTTYTYSVHCAVGICAGPIGGIDTIWADSNVIYQDGVWTSGVTGSATIYTGSTTQNPDSFSESILGSGNVPAYRGLAYIVFESLQLASFGNRLPNITFEIVPAAASADPEWLGGVDASLIQLPQAAQGNALKPVILAGSSSEARQMLIGGYQSSGSTSTFEVVNYDVTDTTPIEIARVQSASFAASDPQDHSWALAPDGRYLAMYLQDSSAPTHYFVIYDTETQTFGDVLSINLTSSSVTKQLAWLDQQHFVIDDISGGVRGLHVLARAGLDIIDLGFFAVWGSGSGSTRQPLEYAQFTPAAGGLINYMTDFFGLSFSAIYACALAWRNNTLVAGTPYTLASGLSPGSGSGPHANLVRTTSTEWTLCYATVEEYFLMSFEPGTTSASITRAWTAFSPSFGTGTSTVPLYYGTRLVLAQRSEFESQYRLSEISLDSSGFTLVVDAVPVDGVTALSSDFGAARIDSSRFLLEGVAGGFDIAQLGIIQRNDSGDTLDAIAADILNRAGYVSGDYDVTALADTTIEGYILQEPMTARAALQPLQAFQAFDLVESADQLKAVLRSGTAAVEIPPSEWRAGPDKQPPPPPQEITRAQELDLPLEVDVDYIDPSRDFEVNCQRARRIVTAARAVQKLTLPIVCDAATAKQIAETRLYTSWAERELIKLRYSRRYLAAEPGDVVDLGNGSLMRITSVNQAGGLIEAQGFLIYAAANTSTAAADTGQISENSDIVALNTALFLMDLPLLRSEDDQPGVYAGATGLPGWVSASVWRAGDGINYNTITSLTTPVVGGIATTALADAPTYYMDNASTVNVQLIQGQLSSCTLGDLFNGVNAGLLGNEIIQFQTATLISSGLYQLSNLLRGRRATESATSTHAVGENFVLLNEGAVDFLPALLTDRGRTYEFRALTKGQSLGDAQDNDFTYNLITLQPFSPVHVTGSRASGVGSDLTVNWIRRARLNSDWADYIDVPLDEPAELYDVDVMNGMSAIRTFSALTSPTVTYTAAEQSSDWGTVPSTFTLNIYQISSVYGRGQAATVTL